MAKYLDSDSGDERTGIMSRRTFIEGVLIASAVAGIPIGRAEAGNATRVLTIEQKDVLTTVLNRLIPSEGAMPAAGDLGISSFIESILIHAPHLRQPVEEILGALRAHPTLLTMSDSELDRLISAVEREHDGSFDVLLQITYTGYYSDPDVLARLGTDSDEVGFRRLDCFDRRLLDSVNGKGDGTMRSAANA